MGSSGWALDGSRVGHEVIVNSGATLAANYSHQFGWTGTLANITVNSGGVFNGSLGHFIGRLALNGNASVLARISHTRVWGEVFELPWLEICRFFRRVFHK
jgi:hypothetical protein